MVDLMDELDRAVHMVNSSNRLSGAIKSNAIIFQLCMKKVALTLKLGVPTICGYELYIKGKKSFTTILCDGRLRMCSGVTGWHWT